MAEKHKMHSIQIWGASLIYDNPHSGVLEPIITLPFSIVNIQPEHSWWEVVSLISALRNTWHLGGAEKEKLHNLSWDGKSVIFRSTHRVVLCAVIESMNISIDKIDEQWIGEKLDAIFDKLTPHT